MTRTASMYDSTDIYEIPDTAQYVASYYNGRYANYTEAVQRWPHSRVYAIDVLANAPEHCSILDVETGDATPGSVPGWVEARLKVNSAYHCRLYCNLSTWPAVKARVAALAEAARRQVRYWIANPTGQPHIVPGADATQYLWGTDYDESLINEATFNG